MRKVKYIILQLPLDHNNKFLGWDLIKSFNLHEYNQVYVGELETEKDIGRFILEDIYSILNGDHKPTGYNTHSLSTSDIIVIYGGKGKGLEYYYCDSVGFKILPIINLVEKQIKTFD